MKKKSAAAHKNVCLMLALLATILGCSKSKPTNADTGPAAATYSAEVLQKWMTLQLRLMRNATGIANNAFARYYAYTGVVALEALKPGVAAGTFNMTWNGLTGLPVSEPNKAYKWTASENAGLALINKSIFINASVADKAAIDSLESAVNISFAADDTATISRSQLFGKSVATAVYNWSETDGYKNASAPYTLPVGPGLWVPTPPANAAATTPYWGNNRPLIANSGANSQPAAPVAYSTDPNSDFYKMVKQLYDISQTLTTDQKNQAIFWKDVPGVTSPGHWLSILLQVDQKTNVKLDKAAFAYALTGTCLNDALISCWQTKYKYNLIRPISYLQTTMGYSTWSTVIPTPAHPEYASAHAILSASAADAFTYVFGDIGSVTDTTYNYLGYPAKTFASFKAIGEDAAMSRVYAGIHYMPTVQSGLIQGRVVTANILATVNH